MAGLRAFIAAILCWTSFSLGPCPECKVAALGTIGGRYRYAARNLAGGIPPSSCSLSHEIVDSAFRNVKLQFISEYVGDIPIRQPAAAQLVYQFAVRLQTGAPRFLGHLAQNVVKFVFHRPPKRINMHRTEAGQDPDKSRTTTGQSDTRYAVRPNLSRKA